METSNDLQQNFGEVFRLHECRIERELHVISKKFDKIFNASDSQDLAVMTSLFDYCTYFNHSQIQFKRLKKCT